MPYVYLITNKINGKKYVGQTKDTLDKRFYDHCRSRKITYLQNAVNKYGKNNFEIKPIFETSDISILDEKEIFFIKQLNTIHPYGYNLTYGGSRPNFSDSTKNKMREAKLGKTPYVMTDEIKRKISNSLKGRKPSWIGKERTKEHSEKLSKSLKGRKVWNKGLKSGTYEGSEKQKADKARWQREWRAKNKDKVREYWDNWEFKKSKS